MSPATPVSDVPTAALVGPFDETPGHKTYLTVHGPNAVSPGTGVPAVVTHWTFWSDSCSHLADFNICLTQDDSAVVDVSNMGGIGPNNEVLTSRFDLTGYRGSYTVHAFEADVRCRAPADAGFVLVPGAINGTWSIANTNSNAGFGDRAFGLGLAADGTVAVPDDRFGAVDLPFFQPDSLSMSDVILLTVVEGFGDFPGELGPPQGIIRIDAQAKVCDNQETCLSLPDVIIGCALFSSLIPAPDALIPETLMPGSGGFFELSSPRFIVNSDPTLTGDKVWIYTFHGQQLGPFGTGARGTYVQKLTPTATPLPSASPSPTATALASPTPEISPSVTPTLPTATPSTTSTPSESPTPVASATPSASPTATPSASPGASATPSVTSTPSPTSSPGVSATPAPTSTPVPTQV